MTAGETLQLPETKMIQIHGKSLWFPTHWHWSPSIRSSLQNLSVVFMYGFKFVMYPVQKYHLFSISTPIHLNVQPLSLFLMQPYEFHIDSLEEMIVFSFSRKIVQIQLIYWLVLCNGCIQMVITYDLKCWFTR